MTEQKKVSLKFINGIGVSEEIKESKDIAEVVSTEVKELAEGSHMPLNIVTTELKYELPLEKQYIQSVTYQDIDMSKFNFYNQEMNKLDIQYKALKGSKEKYSEQYIKTTVKELREKARDLRDIALLDMESMKENTLINPIIEYSTVSQIDTLSESMNKNNTIQLVQSLLMTESLTRIKALLKDNMINSTVRFMIKNYCLAQLENKEKVYIHKDITMMIQAINLYEYDLFNKAQLESILVGYDFLERMFKETKSESSNKYPKFSNTPNELNYYDFTTYNLNH